MSEFAEGVQQAGEDAKEMRKYLLESLRLMETGVHWSRVSTVMDANGFMCMGPPFPLGEKLNERMKVFITSVLSDPSTYVVSPGEVEKAQEAREKERALMLF